MQFGINVFDFGAKGDGVTDDTAAIQAAINFAAERGGGKILFPYTNKGYRIASPGIEEYDGMKVRAQLVIPTGSVNIQLEGEMPCKLLYNYQVIPPDVAIKNKRTPTQFGTMKITNTTIFSDWEAPEVHDPEERPWSILAAPEGKMLKGNFSSFGVFAIKNLEFRVKLNTDKMYPTQSCVNLQNVSRVNIQDSQFCLDENVGDTFLGKELMENPCHTFGLMTSGDQNDNNVIRNAAVQGFKYGFVFSEHVVAEFLYAHNCEEAITFHDSSHLSALNHVVAQHNRKIFTTTRGKLFGHEPGPCNVRIGSVNFECGTGLLPKICQLEYGVYDPEHRFHGYLYWHKPWGEQKFPALHGPEFKVEHF